MRGRGDSMNNKKIAKLDIKKTVLVGLGFFTVAIVWSLYNVAVPTYLNDIFKGLKTNKFLIGCIMTIDNIFAMAFNPMFGKFSDNTQTRFGRRMPYLMVGIPVAAMLFFLIPFVKDSLWMLMTVVIAMNFFMCVYRTPTVALMPDLTPPQLRSQANGIINLMGGLGTALAMGVGAVLFAKSEVLPFALGATIMIATIITMFFTVKEPKEVYAKEEKKDDPHVVLSKSMKRSLVLILCAIFFWFVGYNGVETYLSIFCQEALGLDKNVASSFFLTVSGTFLLFAIPAGYIGAKIGRKKSILIGISCMATMAILLLFVRNNFIIYLLMALAGLGWAMININSLPMVLDMAGKKTGTYTGYYYFFSMSAAVFGPILLGGVMDLITANNPFTILPVEIMFPIAFLSFLLAGVCMLFVKKGHGDKAHMPENVMETLDIDD
jgi:Na+/melibiose symporter-like transporter